MSRKSGVAAQASADDLPLDPEDVIEQDDEDSEFREKLFTAIGSQNWEKVVKLLHDEGFEVDDLGVIVQEAINEE